MIKQMMLLVLVVMCLGTGCASTGGVVRGSSMPSSAPEWVAYPVGKVVRHTITLDDGTQREVPAVHGTYRLGMMHRSQCGAEASAKLMSIDWCKSTFKGSISVRGDTTKIKSNEKTVCVGRESSLRGEASWSQDPMGNNGTFHCLYIRW
jgi:hypothetical protein